MNPAIGDILHTEEIKEIIAKLVEVDIEGYGSKLWFKQDENLQKLNMQTHVNAIMKTDEFIMDECVSQDKLKLLIYDLVVSEAWKRKVLPLLKNQYAQMNTFRSYIAVYHEAVVANLLEILLYYNTAVMESGDLLVDVIDWAYDKLVRQIGKEMQKLKRRPDKKEELTPQEKVKRVLERKPEEEFQRQIEDIEFSLCMMAISLIRYVSDYINNLPIGVIHHLVVECNIFAVLVPLIEAKPWLRVNDKNERQRFENNKWSVLEKSEYGRLPKVEGQVWITLYNLFMNPECRKKYQLTEERKSVLLRLRKYMNEVLLDQIPMLSIMLRALEELSLMNVPSQPINNPFVVQLIPTLKNRVVEGKDWNQIANRHRDWLTAQTDEAAREDIKRLAQLYSNSTIEGLTDGFKCAKCSKEAFKRCSKCKNMWYCSRECQVADWKEHKPKCTVDPPKETAAPVEKNALIELD